MGDVMPKIKIQTTIISNTDNIVNECIGIYQNETLKYFEDKTTKMTFYYKKNILKRETEELMINFYFNKEIMEIKDKKLDISMNMKIKVNKIIRNDKNIEVSYTIDNIHDKEKYIYKLEVLK